MATKQPDSDRPRVGINHPTVVPNNSSSEPSVESDADKNAHGSDTVEGVVTLRVTHGSSDGAIAVVARRLGEKLSRVDVTDAIGRSTDSESSVVDLFVEWSGRRPRFHMLESETIEVHEVEVFDHE